MEPTFEQEPGTGDLPQPVISEEGAVAAHSQEHIASPEIASFPASAPSSQVIPQDQPTQAPQQVAPDPAAASPVATSLDDSLIADDADLIEKEWVARAKAIVDQTKTDPFVQNKELNKVKADYIKKRYNKDVKVSE